MKHLRRALVIFLAVKTVMGLQNVIYPKPSIASVAVTGLLETLYHHQTDTFSVLDRTDISFLLSPHRSCEKTKVVFSVLTAPNNEEKREKLRQQFSDRDDVFLLFLLGRTASAPLQERLRAESAVHRDMLQISVEDHYTTLSYKTLSGFIWTSRFCGSARFVAKIDDDISLDLDRLVDILEVRPSTDWPDTILCPSVMRNMRPWRQNHTKSIMGKWSIQREEMDRRVYPDFCPGWLYVTTPRVGLLLAEVSVVLPGHRLINAAKLDDIFVTGFLRERVSGVTVEQFQGGWSGHSWNSFFSHCPFLGITKNIFYNDLVLDKGSGKTSYIKGKKFYWCAFLEFYILENIEFLLPGLQSYTAPVWSLCHRE